MAARSPTSPITPWEPEVSLLDSFPTPTSRPSCCHFVEIFRARCNADQMWSISCDRHSCDHSRPVDHRRAAGNRLRATAPNPTGQPANRINPAMVGKGHSTPTRVARSTTRPDLAAQHDHRLSPCNAHRLADLDRGASAAGAWSALLADPS